MSVSAIILAAGASSRFDRGHKLLAEIDGVPIICHVARAIGEANVRDVVIVTGANGREIETALGKGRWRIVQNPRPEDGLSASLREGLDAIGPDDDGALVMLGDLPGASTALVDRLIAAFDTASGNAIVFPRSSDGRQGHPVIWPRFLFPALEGLTGDTGGRAILQAHRDLWRPIATDDRSTFADIDTREDLHNFIDRFSKAR